VGGTSELLELIPLIKSKIRMDPDIREELERLCSDDAPNQRLQEDATDVSTMYKE
jgi:hypothetical protein